MIRAGGQKELVYLIRRDGPDVIEGCCLVRAIQLSGRSVRAATIGVAMQQAVVFHTEPDVVLLGGKVIESAGVFPLIVETQRRQNPIVPSQIDSRDGPRISVQQGNALRAEAADRNDIPRKACRLV